MTTEVKQSEVEKAEQTIATIRDKQKSANTRACELADERQRISFAAHAANDQKAQQRLAAIHAEIAAAASSAASLDAALTEANVRLDTARRNEAIAADRAAALLLREKVAQFKEHGIELGHACKDVSMWVNEMIAMLDEIHGLGQPFPTSEQFRVSCTNALKTLVQSLPQSWCRDFEFPLLQPHQKKDFG